MYGSHLPDSLNEPASDDLVQKALVYFEGTDELRRKAQAYFYKGQLLAYKNEYTDAVHYYLKAKCIMEKLDEPLFTYLICQKLANIYRDQELCDKQHIMYTDSALGITCTHELLEVQAKYDHEKLLNLNNELRINQSRHEIIGLTIILVLFGAIIIYQYRLAKKTKSLQEAKDKIQSCEIRISSNEEQIQTNEDLITSLNQNTHDLNELRLQNKDLYLQNERLNSEISRNIRLLESRHVTFHDTLSHFDKLRRLKTHPRYLDEKDWKIVMEWVNLQYGNFILRLGEDTPELTVVDKRYCCLIKMGFTNPEIAVFMGVAPESVAKLKQRLKQRFKKRALFPDDEYLSVYQYLMRY